MADYSNRIRQDKINISKMFLFKTKFRFFVTMIITLILMLFFIAIGYIAMQKPVKIKDEGYKITRKIEKEIKIDDEVVVTETDYKIYEVFNYTILNNSKVFKGKIKTLEHGIVNINDKPILLKDKEYAYECIGGDCEIGKVYITKQSNILGYIK